jgi:hypothetical protein
MECKMCDLLKPPTTAARAVVTAQTGNPVLLSDPIVVAKASTVPDSLLDKAMEAALLGLAIAGPLLNPTAYVIGKIVGGRSRNGAE